MCLADLELDLLGLAYKALEPNENRMRRYPPAPEVERVVRYEKNPLDYCADCGSRDYFAEFRTEIVNGVELAFCPRCE